MMLPVVVACPLRGALVVGNGAPALRKKACPMFQLMRTEQLTSFPGLFSAPGPRTYLRSYHSVGNDPEFH